MDRLGRSGGGGGASSSSPDAAALSALPRHRLPRLRKVSISGVGEEMKATVFSGGLGGTGVTATEGDVMSDLGGGEVVVVAVVAQAAPPSSSSSSSSSASAITFEFPETPSLFDAGRESTSGASSSVTLVSWGDGGGRGSSIGVAEA